MWSRTDNQEVGLEAAILERVRNSSLVKWFRADNVSGLKPYTEAAGVHASARGSGAFRKPAKGHREVAWRYRKSEC